MNTKLWGDILNFKFDIERDEYTFSTKLAFENYWTKNFTYKVILEYKKFMYIAATSDFMVVPSPIIDVVWHQHILNSKLYKEFGDILQKEVQHVPSTGNKMDLSKLNQAKIKTREAYISLFGEIEVDVWNYEDMLGSMHLNKSKFKIRSFINFGIILFLLSVFPAFYFLKNIYVHIENPYFLYLYIGLFSLSIACLECWNYYYLKRKLTTIPSYSFVKNLDPLELVYIKHDDITDYIHPLVNKLVIDKYINIDKFSHKLFKINQDNFNTNEEHIILNAIEETGISYPKLIQQLEKKRVFNTIENTFNAFIKYFHKSEAFGNLFYFNFFILSSLLLLGGCRILTGLYTGHKISFILILFLFTFFVTIWHLNRTTLLFTKVVIPKYYLNNFSTIKEKSNIDWRYFLLGSSIFVSSFRLIFLYFKDQIGVPKSRSFGGNGGSGCGSSCGGGCGGCGGCGGGD